MNQPNINVTPLIDVLLVLLIIFMVVAPLSPSAFQARIPAQPPENDNRLSANADTLVVTIERDSSIRLNGERGLGSGHELSPLIDRLKSVFASRTAAALPGEMSPWSNPDRRAHFSDRAARTVFIKAPRDAAYGSIVRVVDAVKLAGAQPIALQIDDL